MRTYEQVNGYTHWIESNHPYGKRFVALNKYNNEEQKIVRFRDEHTFYLNDTERQAFRKKRPVTEKKKHVTTKESPIRMQL